MELKFFNNWPWTKSYSGFLLLNIWWDQGNGIGGLVICNFGIEVHTRRSPLHSSNFLKPPIDPIPNTIDLPQSWPVKEHFDNSSKT